MQKTKAAPKMVKVCRASGMPVTIEHIEGYKADWQAIYDKVMLKVGFTPDSLHKGTPEMNARAQRILNRVERLLLKRYPNTGLWAELKSRRAWLKAVEQHGPIAVAKSLDGGDMVYILLDVPIN
jgi:hypothetical protein